MKQLTARVVSKGAPIKGLYRPHGRSILFSQTITLKCPEIAGEARPGQFVMLNCGDECMLPRPFSVHQVINKEDLMLYFAVLENGNGTNWLAQRGVGDTVDLLGPLGNGFSIYPSSHKLLLVAGGMGVATLRFLADEAVKRGLPVTLLYGTPTEQRYPEGLLPPQIKLVTVTEDGSAGKKGRITEFIPEHIDWADQIFACGPLPMYKTMTQIPALKDKPVQVSLETRMGCGRGVCYGCTVKTKGGLKQVCQNGPVFNLDDVLWDELAY